MARQRHGDLGLYQVRWLSDLPFSAVFLLLIALSPGHPIVSDLHFGVTNGLDVHAVVESLIGGNANMPPAPLGPVVIPGRKAAHGNDDRSDDGQEDHLAHLDHMHAGE
jgi:hypothetical protein